MGTALGQHPATRRDARFRLMPVVSRALEWDVAGVFSRYFIVGSLLPAFFALVALPQTLTDSFLAGLPRCKEWPPDRDPRRGRTGRWARPVRVAVLGPAPLPGLPASVVQTRPAREPLYTLLMKRQQRRFTAHRPLPKSGRPPRSNGRDMALDRYLP